MRGDDGDGHDQQDELGTGSLYRLRTVAAGDGDWSLSTPLTRYYAEAGTPPGRWLGTGLLDLGSPDLRAGAEVSEEQLRLLIGQGTHPVTGEPLGRRYSVFEQPADGSPRRRDNDAYVLTEQDDDNHSAPHGDGGETSARSVLTGVLANRGAELSAHQTITDDQDHRASVARLAAEYDTIAAGAQRGRWASLRRAGLDAGQLDDVLGSDAFGPLAAELRRAEANGHNLDRLLPAAVHRHRLDDADDIAAALRRRVELASSQRPRHRGDSPRLIAGLIPEARGPTAPDLRQALDECRNLIEQRAPPS